ncbi:MAG: hypothetical protein JW793_10135, partial [Acidobacteria bacterium]|nr:hypothetical protein [Acidobacteriota bacterium]
SPEIPRHKTVKIPQTAKLQAAGILSRRVCMVIFNTAKRQADSHVGLPFGGVVKTRVVSFLSRH